MNLNNNNLNFRYRNLLKLANYIIKKVYYITSQSQELPFKTMDEMVKKQDHDRTKIDLSGQVSKKFRVSKASNITDYCYYYSLMKGVREHVYEYCFIAQYNAFTLHLLIKGVREHVYDYCFTAGTCE